MLCRPYGADHNNTPYITGTYVPRLFCVAPTGCITLNFQPSTFNLQLLTITYYLLPINYYLLTITYYLLPITY